MLEKHLQRDICAYLAFACPEVVFWHVPNGQIMSGVIRGLLGKQKAETVIGRIMNGMKAQGLTPGVPDLVLHWSGGGILYLELKSDEGNLSDAQKGVHKRLRNIGFPVWIVRSMDEFKRMIFELKIPCRERLESQL